MPTLTEIGSDKKRSLNSQVSSPSKKKKKLSAVKARALAALESDSDDNEGGVKDCNIQAEEGGGWVNLSRTSDLLDTKKKGVQHVVHKVSSIVGEGNETESTNGNSNNNEKDTALSDIGDRGANDPGSGACVDWASKDTATNNLGAAAQPTDKEMGEADINPLQIKMLNKQCENEEDVIPHAPKSEYNNILSSYLSTPFDDLSMRSLHCRKEGIIRQRPQSFDDFDFDGWIASQDRELVPTILPQKELIKCMKEKQRAATTLRHNEIIGGGSSTASFIDKSIDKEVAAFLIHEAKQNVIQKLEKELQNRTLRMPGVVHNPAIERPDVRQQSTHVDGLQHQIAAQRLPPTIHQQQPNQNQLLSHMINNQFASTGQQQQHSLYNIHNNFTQQQHQLHHPGYQHNIMNGYGWQLPQPAAPVYPFAGVQNNPHNNNFAAMAPSGISTARQFVTTLPPAVHHNNPQTSAATKVAMASKETKLTRDQIAKLPVAFGFSLDDDGASKLLAQAATELWYKQGNAMNKSSTEMTKKRGTNKENKTPSKSGTPTSSGGGSTPKTPAILLEAKSAGPDLPEGWTTKKFQRTGGKTAGSSDKYWYSPDQDIKFRSMKGCKQFVAILKELGVDGNENSALKLYKERGFRF